MAMSVEVKGISKTYPPNIKAVDNVSFRVEEGESIAIVGPNGAGKTTTIHIILGLLRPDKGEVTIDGKDMLNESEAAEARRYIGFAPQNTALDFFLTVWDNIEMYLKLNGVARDKRREAIRKAAEMLGISDILNRRVETLSGGLMRRVHIARALALQPRILILDEPTVGLDPESREAFWGELREYLSDTGATLIWSSHYLEEIERNSDRVLLLHRGSIVMDSSPGEIIERFSKPVLIIRLNDADVASNIAEVYGGFVRGIEVIFEDVEMSTALEIIQNIHEKDISVKSIWWGGKPFEDTYLEVMKNLSVGSSGERTQDTV